MRYSKWDEVVLKVEDSFGYREKIFNQLKVMILGVDNNSSCDHPQYLCYVPVYEVIPMGFSTFTIDRHHAKHFNIEAKFIGDTGCFITNKNPIYKHLPAAKGEKCDHCGDWADGAERNYGVYLCRSCRENPYR